jgi:hypothetical protein
MTTTLTLAEQDRLIAQAQEARAAAIRALVLRLFRRTAPRPVVQAA